MGGSDNYQKLELLGEGAGGVVQMARHVKTKRIVAVKKARMGKANDGIAMSALREVKLLQEIKHENVIELVDVYASNTNINLVFEYCHTDLERVIRDGKVFLSDAEIKCCMQMILHGVSACHEHWTMHRDLKPNNILVGADGNLKLADFGLARIHGSPNPRFTYLVVTRWYRAPELLFGAREYGAGVDIWAVGCIFAELMLRMAYMPGDSDIDQLGKIFLARGTPTEEDWPGMSTLPDFMEFAQVPAPDHRQLFSAASEEALDLLNQFLRFDPNKRISAADALKHPYFSTPPLACSKEQLLAMIMRTTKDKTAATEGDPVPASRHVDGRTGNGGDVVESVDRTPAIPARISSNSAQTPISTGRFKRKLQFDADFE